MRDGVDERGSRTFRSPENESETSSSPAKVLPCESQRREVSLGTSCPRAQESDGTHHLLLHDLVAVELPGLDDLLRLDVPELDRPVGRARGNLLSVPTEGDRKDALVVRGTVCVDERTLVVGGLPVIQVYLPVGASRREDSTVGAVCERLNKAGVAAGRHAVLEGHAIEQADGEVIRARPAGRDQTSAIALIAVGKAKS